MNRRAFTLVELLVVIAIVGLLSSVAVISMSTSRDKAKLASGMSFDATLARTLGTGLVAEYNFEEGSGTTTSDTSGLGNTGTLVGGPTWSTDTYGTESRYSLVFQSGRYVRATSGFGIGDKNFTIALWIKTTSATGQMYVVTNSGSGDGYRFGLGGGRVSFLLGNGPNSEGNCTSQAVNDGKWHHIAGVFDRTGLKMTCYIDGHASPSLTFPSAYAGMSDGLPYIGSGYCCTAFVGQLDNVKVFTQNLSGAMINDIYLKERARFVAANIIDGIERVVRK